MKRATIYLAVTSLVLACTLAVYAGAQKIELTDFDGDLATAEGGIHATANGFAIVNTTPDGATDVVIQIQLRDGAPEYEYVVKTAGVEIGRFTTTKKGTGGLHVNLPPVPPEDDGLLGGAVNIWTTDVATRLLRAVVP